MYFKAFCTITFILIGICCVHSIAQGPLQKSKFFKLEKQSVCENDTLLPISVQNISYSFSRNLLNFRGTFSVKEVIEAPIEHSFNLWKCKSVDYRCELFTNSSSPDFCEILEGKVENMKLAFENFFSNIKPKMTCPIQPGTYDVNEAVINLDSISHLPIEGNLWHLEVFLIQRKDEEEFTLIGCLESHIRVFSGSTRGNRG